MTLSRRNLLSVISTGLAMPFVRPSWAATTSLNVYNWTDYIGETTIADFQSETGISVVYDVYASTEEMEAKMMAGSSGYDLVIQAGRNLARMRDAGVYQKIDHSQLKNWGNLDQNILKIVEGFDPGHDFGVPYTWGSVGMTYNLDMVKERLPNADLNSLATILDPANAAALADCGISLLDSPMDWGPMVMKYLGIDPNTAGPAEFAKLAEAMKPIREYITTFDNSNYLTTIPNGELCAINSWSGDYGVAKARAAEANIQMNLGYFVPKTGAPAWFDLWCMPSDATNTENAMIFLDYMLRPEVVAAATNYTGYASANAAATAFVDPAIAADPAVYPDAETLSRMYTPTAQTPEQESALIRIWTDIKSGS